MGKELVLHGWQLVAFAFANQGLMLAAVAFVMWMDKRRHCCLGPEVPCDKHRAENNGG
jgi:uncharacterized iron-regulated membrane protein